MKKRIFAMILSMMLVMPLGVCAEEYAEVVLNGQKIAFDVPAQIINGRTMVPMRAIFENLGATVQWVEEHQLIIATRKTAFVTMKIGSDVLVIQDVVTGEKNVVTLDVAPQVVNDRTLVPVRAIAESLDTLVEWVEETHTVILTTQNN